MKSLVKSFILSSFALGIIVGGVTAGIWYYHTHLKKYERVVCDPEKLEPGFVCLKTVLEDWKKNVILVDTRTQDQFERSAVIEGDGEWSILEMPVVPLRNEEGGEEMKGKAMPLFLQAHSKGQKIVVFCDKSCSSSKEVAAELRKPDLGIDAPVYILEGGWESLWREIKVLKEKNK